MMLFTVVAFSMLVNLFPLSPTTASTYHFPDCRGTQDINRVFNILDIVFLEENQGNHTVYFSWDVQLQKFIKADWLYALTINNDFRGVIWDKDNAGQFKVIFAPWLAKIIKYNSDRNLFHVVQKDLKKIEPPDKPSFEVEPNKLRIYQSGDNRYYFDEAEKSLYLGNSTSPLKRNFMLNGVFSSNSHSKETYVFVSHNHILNYTTKNSESKSAQHPLKFEDVLPCNRENETNWPLLIGAIAQVLLVILLIFLNIKYVTDWLSCKPKSKLSERIDSRAPVTDARRPPSSGRRSTPESSSDRARSTTPRKVRPKNSTIGSSTKKSSPAKKIFKLTRNRQQMSSEASTTADSVAECIKR